MTPGTIGETANGTIMETEANAEAEEEGEAAEEVAVEEEGAVMKTAVVGETEVETMKVMISVVAAVGEAAAEDGVAVVGAETAMKEADGSTKMKTEEVAGEVNITTGTILEVAEGEVEAAEAREADVGAAEAMVMEMVKTVVTAKVSFDSNSMLFYAM